MARREHKSPLQFADYRRFGVTEDFIKYLLDIGWTIHRNEIVASQLVITAFLYLQGRVTQLEGRARKRVGRAMKVFLDYPQIVQKLVFELSEKYEMAQEERHPCEVSTLLIRYIKALVSFYLDYNSYYVVVGQTRYFLDYAPRHLELLDREIAPDLLRGGDKQLTRVQKQIYGELVRRFKDRLKQSSDGRRKYAFELMKNPDQYVDLAREALSRFNLWISPPDLRQGRIGKSLHQDLGKAELERYRALLDFDALIELIRRLSLPEPKSCWAFPDFCLASNGTPLSNPVPPVWTDKELKAIEDTITATLARRQSASLERLSILADGKEQCSFTPRETVSISFDLRRGEKLIEVIARESDGDLPLAAYLIDYDEESYGRRWRVFGERRIKSTVILEGRQQIRLTVSLMEKAGEEASDARITVGVRPPGLENRVRQWWQSFRNRNWRLAGSLLPAQIVALCLCAILGLAGYSLFFRTMRHSAVPGIVERKPETEPILSPSPPLPRPTGSIQVNQDDLDLVTVGKGGTVLLPDLTPLPAPLSGVVRELIETGEVTPTEETRRAMAAIDGLTREAQRQAPASGDSLPVPVSPILTAIRSRRPTLHWAPVPGAERYQVRVAFPPVREDGRIVWEASVANGTRVTLPPGVLQAGQVYLWQVETSVEGRSRISVEAGFRVLDAASLRRVKAAERRYRGSALVRAGVYERYGLYEEALSRVERLARMNPNNSRARDMLARMRRRLGRE
ncbi:MAG TPA: hypothetical protein VJ302_00080 [Blastocatellia bacterium]|nr:hypothetical protein [Blastocatellia bacterium]